MSRAARARCGRARCCASQLLRASMILRAWQGFGVAASATCPLQRAGKLQWG
jgi:hypothetical protein